MPHKNYPIFVLGAARSGTTMMVHILMRSGDFPTYETESQIMSSMFSYGDLSDTRNRSRFVADFLQSRQFERSGLREEHLKRLAADCQDYADFLGHFMDAIALSQNKSRWIEKTPAHTRFLCVLARRFPTARFIHVIRDGRDVALSRRKLGWTPSFGGNGFLQLLWAGLHWQSIVSRARKDSLQLEDRYLEVRYEDLVLNRQQTLDRVAQFTEVDLHSSERDTEESESAARPNSAFEDAAKVRSGRAVERWKAQIDSVHRERLTWALRRTLGRLGYEVPPTQLSPLSRLITDSQAMLLSGANSAKEWLRENTPLGRRTASPLEVGKD